MHITKIHQACAADGCCVISEGTMDPRHVLPRLLAALATLSPPAHQQLTMSGAGLSAIPQYALDDAMHDWWATTECDAAFSSIIRALNEHAPEGFVVLMEAGDRFGFFLVDPPPAREILPAAMPWGGWCRGEF
jgi:hypothetical protein